MTVAEHVREVAARSVARSLPPSNVARDEREREFVRYHCAAIWDAVWSARADPEACPACGGSGVANGYACDECDATGRKDKSGNVKKDKFYELPYFDDGDDSDDEDEDGDDGDRDDDDDKEDDEDDPDTIDDDEDEDDFDRKRDDDDEDTDNDED